VLEECRYELVVPLTLLFSAALLRTPYLAPGCSVLQEAYLLFHQFLAWPEPCSSACKSLLIVIDQEIRAPGISFQRLVRTEQAISPDVNCSKTILEKLRESLAVPSRDGCSETGSVEILTLPFPKCHTCLWEDDNFGNLKTIHLPLAAVHQCHISNSYSTLLVHVEVLKDLLAVDSDLDSPPECFPKICEDDTIDTSIDEEDELDSNKLDDQIQSHRISTTSSSSRDSTFSGYSLSSSWSVPSASSGVESDFSEDTAHEETEKGQGTHLKVRKKPKKKSKSLLGLERLSLIFKTPHSPSTCRRVQSMGYNGDITKDYLMTGAQLKHSGTPMRHPHLNVSVTAPVDPSSPRRHICVRRRPILSCDEGNEPEVPTVVKVVAFGGDREAGRLARAYSDLQQKERRCPQLTKTCKLQFYFVPIKKRATSPGGGHTPTEGQVLQRLHTCNIIIQEI
ncbi:hypothetical protein XENOCAPTIV_001508, partial [Xenoophorus captivus]